MSAIDPNTTLAALVTERPALAGSMDAMGLDYCCGGQRTLAAALAEAGIDHLEALEILESAPIQDRDDDWEGLDGLVDHLESVHHAYLRGALPRLVALGEKVASVHGDRHRELYDVAALVNEIKADLDPHLVKEERVLFPMIRQLATATEAPAFHCGSLTNPISVMLAEHDNVGALLADLRQATDGYQVPDDGCASYRALYDGLAELEADTHLHVHKENNVLFPQVLEAEEALSTGRR